MVMAMEEFSKVGIDLLFCLIIGFLIIQASNSAQHNEDLSNTISTEATRINEASWESN